GGGVGGERRRRGPAVGVGGDHDGGEVAGEGAPGAAAGGAEGDGDALDQVPGGVGDVHSQGGGKGGAHVGRLVVARGRGDRDGRVVVVDGARGRGRAEDHRRRRVQQHRHRVAAFVGGDEVGSAVAVDVPQGHRDGTAAGGEGLLGGERRGGGS